MQDREPITGRSVWTGADLLKSPDWIFTLDEGHLAELDAAIAACRGKPFEQIRRADFPLDRTAGLLEAMAEELDNGRGVAKLRTLPVDRYGDDDIKRMYWGISLYIGTPVYQNRRAELLHVIRDESKEPDFRHKGDEGPTKSAGAKALSTDPLNFHTDTADVLGLLCIANASEGGKAKLASTTKIYNEFLARRPDLLDVLFHDYHHNRPEQYPGKAFSLPLFGLKNGYLTSTFSPANLRKARELLNTPPLTAIQEEALAMIQAIGNEVGLETPYEPGDAQFVNNHFICHGRTGFKNGTDRSQSRYMMRVWLSTPRSHELPSEFGVLWGDVAPGALRGGTQQDDLTRTLVHA